MSSNPASRPTAGRPAPGPAPASAPSALARWASDDLTLDEATALAHTPEGGGWWSLIKGLPLWLLLAGLVLTAAVAALTRASEVEAEQIQFEVRANEVITRLETRLSGHADMLRGVAGLFASQPSGAVSREAFRAYVASLNIANNYPGLQGIGFSQWIAPSDLAAHTERVRNEGFSDYQVRPDNPRETYSSIVFLEPFDWRNRRAFGFDMHSEPVRRAAMSRAADTGEPALSGRVTLVQETDRDVQAGFLVYVPIYRGGQVPATEADRRSRLLGWAYSPIRSGDFVASFLRKEFPSLAGQVNVMLHAGHTADPAQLLHASPLEAHNPVGTEHTVVRELQVLGAPLRVEVTPLASYRDHLRHDYESEVVTASGLLLTLVAVAGATLLRRGHRRLEAALWASVSANERLAASEQRIRDMALHDPLTGLPNRRYLLDRAVQDLALARRHHTSLAVVFIDLDRFKPINDEHGHDVGDAVLKLISFRLKGMLRSSDTVCRQGGDEFVLLLPDVGSRAELAALARRVVQTIERPCETQGLKLSVSASLGVAVFPQDGQDIDALVHAADQAMYHAKEGGRRDPQARIHFASAEPGAAA